MVSQRDRTPDAAPPREWLIIFDLFMVDLNKMVDDLNIFGTFSLLMKLQDVFAENKLC